MIGLDLRETESAALEPALKDLKVVELASGVAGPFCGKLLADYGADVIKVELPEGDPSRLVGPFPPDDHDAGALFLWLNANKRGITLDWEQSKGRRILRDLLSWADVFIDSGPAPKLSRLRLDPSSLLRRNPHLIQASVTPFGRTGPWRDKPATDLTVSALGGFSFVNGIAGREPLKEPGPQTDVLAGVFTYIGIMCALADREISGQGQSVDVSSLEAVAGVLTPRVTMYSYQGVNLQRRAAGNEPIMACQDGYVSMPLIKQVRWETLAQFVNLGEAALDPTVNSDEARRASPSRVREVLEPALANFKKAELFINLAAARVNIGQVLSIPDWKGDPHLKARQFLATVEDPRVGELTYLGPPFRLEGCTWRIRRPAPRPGEHTDEVLREILGYSPRRRAALNRVEG